MFVSEMPSFDSHLILVLDFESPESLSVCSEVVESGTVVVVCFELVVGSSFLVVIVKTTCM